MNLHEDIQRIKEVMGITNEGLYDTSWQNDENDKVTLIDLLNATEDIPVENISVEELKPHLLSWGGDEDEVKKIESADLQYPILIFVNESGEFITIIDGHHRAQKAVRMGLDTIKGKIIPINYLPKDIKKVFKHLTLNESVISALKRRADEIPQFLFSEYTWLDPKRFDSFEEFLERCIFGTTRDISAEFGANDYEDQLDIREKIEPFIRKYIMDNHLEEIRNYYEKG